MYLYDDEIDEPVTAPRETSTCPQCKRINMNKGRNIHIICWQCATDYCFVCENPFSLKEPLSHHIKMCSEYGGAEKKYLNP